MAKAAADAAKAPEAKAAADEEKRRRRRRRRLRLRFGPWRQAPAIGRRRATAELREVGGASSASSAEKAEYPRPRPTGGRAGADGPDCRREAGTCCGVRRGCGQAPMNHDGACAAADELARLMQAKGAAAATRGRWDHVQRRRRRGLLRRGKGS